MYTNSNRQNKYYAYNRRDVNNFIGNDFLCNQYAIGFTPFFINYSQFLLTKKR